jgi:hypothetical protein
MPPQTAKEGKEAKHFSRILAELAFLPEKP